MTVTVRRIRPDDGPLLKRVRLAALLDTPSAFSRTHEEESAYTDDEWARRAADWSAGGEAMTSFAELDGEIVGLVGGHRTIPGTTELVSMWVDPAARGNRVGQALIDAVAEWAVGEPIELWVTHGNDPAVALYARAGFTVTTEVQPLASDPCRNEIRMRRSGA
ncbi:MAG: GNAT family N-acetyltransferase [Actinomycetota bacterium]